MKGTLSKGNRFCFDNSFLEKRFCRLGIFCQYDRLNFRYYFAMIHLRMLNTFYNVAELAIAVEQY